VHISKSCGNYLFNCICVHEISIALNNINTGNWCSYCSNPPKLLCDKKECKLCYEKSFASHSKSKYWSDKNEITSRMIFKNSGNKYIFNCDKCNHRFYIRLSFTHIPSI
jgi:hypothetical protein